MSEDGRREAVDKMRRDGQPAEAIRSFERAYGELRAGAAGTLPDAEL
jgi:hypothetical protein